MHTPTDNQTGSHTDLLTDRQKKVFVKREHACGRACISKHTRARTHSVTLLSMGKLILDSVPIT